METAGYLEHLAADAAALLAAAGLAPQAPVPACPAWDVTDLVRHTGDVHRWVGHIISSRATGRPAAFDAGAPAGWAAVAEWYEAGAADLIAALASVDPDAPVWNWRDGRPAPARFWIRRMAHETVIHRWDAEVATGRPGSIDAALATDGLDEYLSFVPGWLAKDPVAGLEGVLVLSATDAEKRAVVELHPDGLAVHWGGAVPGSAHTTLSGRAEDLVLWLTARRGVDDAGLHIEGDRAPVEAWSGVRFE